MNLRVEFQYDVKNLDFLLDQNQYYFRSVELSKMALKEKHPLSWDEIIQNEYEQVIVLYDLT